MELQGAEWVAAIDNAIGRLKVLANPDVCKRNIDQQIKAAALCIYQILR